MATFKDVKEKYIDYLMDMDLNKMSVMDLSDVWFDLKNRRRNGKAELC